MRDLKATQIFTPPWATNQMLDFLDQKDFQDENTYFFEPSCGNGEMLVVLLERIFEKLLTKYNDENQALVDTLFKFYAIDLDKNLVVECRSKIYKWIMKKIEKSPDHEIINKYLIARILNAKIEHKDFFEVMKNSNIKTGL